MRKSKKSKQIRIDEKENDQNIIVNKCKKWLKVLEIRILKFSSRHDKMKLCYWKLLKYKLWNECHYWDYQQWNKTMFQWFDKWCERKKTDENTKLANGLKDVKKKLAILLQKMFLAIWRSNIADTYKIISLANHKMY